jgi:hypothetical protein
VFQVVGTVTVGDVLKLGGEIATVGKGKVPHALRDGKTLCKGQSAEPQGWAHSPETALCGNCGKHVSSDTWNTSTEGNEVATKKDTKTAEPTEAEKSYAEAAALVESMEKGGITGEQVDTAVKRIEVLILAVSGTERAQLRTRMKAAQSKIADAAKAAAKGSAVATRTATAAPSLASENYKDDTEVVALVGQAAEKVRETTAAVVKGAQGANETAQLLFQVRERLSDKRGLPDLKATSQAYRDAAQAVYEQGGISTAGLDEESDVYRERKRIQTSISGQMDAVRVQAVRALDGASEERRARYSGVKVNEGESLSDAVFRVLKIKPKTALELKNEKNAQKRELEAATSKAEGAATEAAGAADKATKAAPRARVALLLGKLEEAAQSLDIAYFDDLGGKDIADAFGHLDKLEEWIKAVRDRMAPEPEEAK